MTEHNTIQTTTIATETENGATAQKLTDRLAQIRANLSRRPRLLALTATALVGTSLAGVLIANAGGNHNENIPAAAVADNRGTDQHADRSNRTAASTSPTPAAPAPSSPAAPAPAVAAPAPAAPKPAAPKPAAPAPAPKPKPAWVAPMGKYEMTSCFGPRWGTEHQGIDFANVSGTPILSVAAGTVISAGWNDGGYGNMVIVQHGPSTYTLYGHASSVAVHVGQHVEAGQVVSYEGSTGDSTGPHLHFEVWNGMWSRIEPAHFLRAHGVTLPGC